MTTHAPISSWSDPRRRAMAISLAMAVVLLAVKVVAWLATGSAAIFSDAAESVVHLAATVFAAYSLRLAAEPPDESHLYGHGKVAYFAAGFEGAVILLASLGILTAAGWALYEGAEVEAPSVGLVAEGFVCAVNVVLGLYLVRTGERTGSLVLKANGRHVLTDVWTSVGVFVGVGLVALTGASWLDPVVAILVAVHIFRAALGLLREAVEGLMERARPDVTRDIADALADAEAAGLHAGFHQLRHRHTGDALWVDYHLLFDGDLPLDEAHDRAHAVEDRLREHLQDGDPNLVVHVIAHLEPEHHEHAAGHAEPPDPLGL